MIPTKFHTSLNLFVYYVLHPGGAIKTVPCWVIAIPTVDRCSSLPFRFSNARPTWNKWLLFVAVFACFGLPWRIVQGTWREATDISKADKFPTSNIEHDASCDAGYSRWRSSPCEGGVTFFRLLACLCAGSTGVEPVLKTKLNSPLEFISGTWGGEVYVSPETTPKSIFVASCRRIGPGLVGRGKGDSLGSRVQI